MTAEKRSNQPTDHLLDDTQPKRRTKREHRSKPSFLSATGNQRFSRRELNTYNASKEVSLSPSSNFLSILGLMIVMACAFYYISFSTPLPKSIL